jgi:hypothetical protein
METRAPHNLVDRLFPVAFGISFLVAVELLYAVLHIIIKSW